MPKYTVLDKDTIKAEISSWKGWNYLAFAVVFLKKIHKSQKFK